MEKSKIKELAFNKISDTVSAFYDCMGDDDDKWRITMLAEIKAVVDFAECLARQKE